MKIVIAGSRKLPAGQAPRLLIRFLAALPDDAVVMLRSPIEGVPGHFEIGTSRLARALNIEVEWHQAQPTDDTPGRASVYVRDLVMVEQADLVLLFFAIKEASAGYSGTAHLMDKALDAARPMYAYAMADDGTVTRVGEYDPDHLYADIAPSA